MRGRSASGLPEDLRPGPSGGCAPAAEEGAGADPRPPEAAAEERAAGRGRPAGGSRKPSKRGYHHGRLRAALVDTAVELIAERGVHGFSLAEASRRLGVTVAAPYRHFADRDDLLAAVATRATERLAARLDAVVAADGTPEEHAVAVGAAYVRFAAEQRPLFEALFSAGLEKQRYPELAAAAQRAEDRLLAVVREVVAGSAVPPERLMLALITATHGAAALLLDGFFGRPPDDPAVVGEAVGHAVSAVRAVLAGRHAL